MRYLLCAALALAACERRDTAREATTDTTPSVDIATDSAGAPGQTMTALADRLLGSWKARGYDSGSSRAQPFTMTWSRAPDGSMAGQISFEGGEKYNVKVVSTTDTLIVYESEPHRSPTLKAQVVTRTQARMVGDTLVGTYTARAGKGGKTLKGRFTATRG
ncbi:MAG TPA: hypothetical protein VIM84_13325 [Gemmatimonadales bacterium]